ncbi:hypothetical protein Ppro_0241 [Pelobacter propionicus DSM 2379]|uniref:Uncharacterized protein n=2 Tax=Pelobacter propionicus TaxID=29543 RepID=A1AKK6_PELPD|nr:hypothetical protein Ppro_0241 [Pelobacter propionicus DSM 2379]
MMTRKIAAIVIAVAGTVLPCLLAGAMVGIVFRSNFWIWTLGLAAISFPWMLMNRVHTRFYRGALIGKSLSKNIKYAYTSTEYYPKTSLFSNSWWNWYWVFFRRHF